ncbi:hypothetical protein K3495_g6390 [Podosphaera aphanis]|nr:hypothetical protein K3495_g6390 [Podosphaera aphanis]
MVVTPSEVEGIISNIGWTPLDPTDIARFWKLFATIKRRPFDPTGQASRLENFWWRVWGGRQNKLPGLVLADRFQKLLQDDIFIIPQRQSRLQKASTQKNPLVTTHQPALASPPKPMTAAPVPHPILKKPGDPSTTVPRSTARFASPHESEERKGFVPETYATHFSTPFGSQNTRPDKKRSVGPAMPKKKGPVVLASKKKRPVTVRRRSSPSSNDITTKVLGPGPAKSELISSSERKTSMSTLPESDRSDYQALEKSLANKNSVIKNTRVTPKVRRPSSTSGKSVLRRVVGSSSTKSIEREISQTTEKDLVSQRQHDKGKLVDRDSTSILPNYPPTTTCSISPHPEKKPRTNYGNSKFIFKGKIPSQTLGATHIPLAEATSMVSRHTAASGQLCSQASTSNAMSTEQGANSHRSDGSQISKRKLFSPLTTTVKSLDPPALQASLNESNAMSKSRSQLTLLLKKDMARNN